VGMGKYFQPLSNRGHSLGGGGVRTVSVHWILGLVAADCWYSVLIFECH